VDIPSQDSEWPLHVLGDEGWYYFAPSSGGRALRIGVEWLYGDESLFAETPNTALTALEALHWMARELDVERALLIAQARVEGASWTDIGRRVHLTKQAVHRRYREHAERLTEMVMQEGYNDDMLLDYVDMHFHYWAWSE
jgi:hypothetical protein